MAAYRAARTEPDGAVGPGAGAMPALSSIVDSRMVKALLCAGDGNLFSSERPARAARLRPDVQTLDAIGHLASDYRIVCIGLGGRGLLDACLLATRLDRFVTAECRYSVPDDGGSPDGLGPALYEQVCEQLGLGTEDVLAVEHTRAGVLAAAGAGVRTIGNLHYVPARERGPRAVELAQAGAVVVVRSWSTVARLLRCLPFA